MPATRAVLFYGVPDGPEWCDTHMLRHAFVVEVFAVTIRGLTPMGKSKVCDKR